MIGAEEFDRYVSQIALQNSRLRKLDTISVEALDHIAITADEMHQDWVGGVARLLEFMLTGPFSFASLGDSFVERLTLAWLDDLRDFKAYSIWRGNWNNQGIWSSEAQRRENYLRGAAEVHSWLVNARNKIKSNECAALKSYVAKHYFRKGSVDLDSLQVKDLISRKADHIWKKTGNKSDLENWLVSERFVRDFYDHIFGAIDGDKNRCETVLRSIHMLHHGDRVWPITNALELTLAVRFISEDRILEFEQATGVPVF